jgi:HK97 family phage portal protein
VKPLSKTPMGARLRKTAEFFNSLFDYGAGGLPGGFYPVAAGGQAKPPINVARSDTGRLVSPNTTLGISAAWACIWLITDTISTLPFILNKRSSNKVSYGAPAWGEPLFSVLGLSPNAQMSACEFWAFTVASDLLWGNGISLVTRNVNGDPIALEPIRPEYIVPYRQPMPFTPGASPPGDIRYRYYSPLGSADYGADQVFHIKGRTLDGLVGLSIIQYARNSFGIAQSIEEATSDVYRNGMRSGGFVQSDKYLNVEQRTQLKDSLSEFTTGGPRSSSLMVLEGGLKFESISMPPQDVQLLQARQYAVEDVCRWFGVPPVLIGHAAQGVTSWGTGIEQLLLGWQALSLRPYIRRIEQAVGKQLLQPAQQARFFLTIDMDDLTAADSAARSALYASASQNGWMTRNEIRQREDLAPEEGGDSLTVQSNLIPLDKIESMGGQPTHPAPPGQQPGGQPGAQPPGNNPTPPPPPAGGNGKHVTH